MNLQDMVSKMDSKQLQDGLSSISSMLTPEQMRQMQSILSGGSSDMLKNVNMEDVQAQLANNPQIARQLQNADMLKNITDIFKK